MSSEKEVLLRAAGIKKSYDLYDSPYKCLLQILFKGRYNFSRQFKALDGIDFTLHRGECLGIIGRNGAGKSTLLSILSGQLRPTEGTIEKKGNCCALLELGFGFNPDFTGRENIAVAGLMLGMKKSELESKTESIIQFADINDFIDQPVKKYSSGMFVRLAFSLVAHTDSQIRLVDEALAVGDIFFQQKCYRLLEEQKKTSALVLVSHDLNAISTLCDRVLVLEKGRTAFLGEPREAIEFYTHLLYEAPPAAPQSECSEELIPIPEKHRTGQFGSFIGASMDHQVLQAGDILHITARVDLQKDCPLPIIGFFFNDHFGKRIFGNCIRYGQPIAAGGIQFSFDLEWPDIAPGEYTLTLGIGSGEDVMAQTVYCWATDFCAVSVIKEKDIVHGVFNVIMNHFSCKGV